MHYSFDGHITFDVVTAVGITRHKWETSVNRRSDRLTDLRTNDGEKEKESSKLPNN